MLYSLVSSSTILVQILHKSSICITTAHHNVQSGYLVILDRVLENELDDGEIRIYAPSLNELAEFDNIAFDSKVVSSRPVRYFLKSNIATLMWIPHRTHDEFSSYKKEITEIRFSQNGYGASSARRPISPSCAIRARYHGYNGTACLEVNRFGSRLR